MKRLIGELIEPKRLAAVRRFLDGDNDALRILYDHDVGMMINQAGRWLRCLRIAPCQFDGDDAVNSALELIRQARDSGKLFQLERGEHFRKLFLAVQSSQLERLEARNTITEPISVTGLSLSAFKGLAPLGIMQADGGNSELFFFNQLEQQARHAPGQARPNAAAAVSAQLAIGPQTSPCNN
jgi:hypothetical protein